MCLTPTGKRPSLCTCLLFPPTRPPLRGRLRQHKPRISTKQRDVRASPFAGTTSRMSPRPHRAPFPLIRNTHNTVPAGVSSRASCNRGSGSRQSCQLAKNNNWNRAHAHAQRRGSGAVCRGVFRGGPEKLPETQGRARRCACILSRFCPAYTRERLWRRAIGAARALAGGPRSEALRLRSRLWSPSQPGTLGRRRRSSAGSTECWCGGCPGSPVGSCGVWVGCARPCPTNWQD